MILSKMGTRFRVWERDWYAIGYAIFLRNSLIIKGGTRFLDFSLILMWSCVFFCFLYIAEKKGNDGKWENRVPAIFF